jgi:hypothetical protein
VTLASMGVATATRAETALDVYGLRVSVRGDWPEVLEELRLDFAWFERAPGPGPSDVEVVIERRPPDFEGLGDIPATFVTPRNVVYRDGPRTVVDYFGHAVAVVDRDGARNVIQGEEKHLVHQAAYLFLLSRIGQHLDARRLPRLHGLGLAGKEGAIVVMLPSGGGKSTLALRALRSPGVSLLSEDSPLIDRRGMVHPFPLRIGVNPTDAGSLPDGQVRRIERLEFHPKLVLELEAFADRVATSPKPLRHIVIGRRRLGREARIEPAPRVAALGPLFREAVVGVGLYQGMEFVLQRGARDVLGQAGPALTRAACCAAGLARAKVWRLETGRDHDRNWAAVEPLLQ